MFVTFSRSPGGETQKVATSPDYLTSLTGLRSNPSGPWSSPERSRPCSWPRTVSFDKYLLGPLVQKAILTVSNASVTLTAVGTGKPVNAILTPIN